MRSLLELYSRLYDSFGPQGWWPAKSSFEMIVGAILTQNTAWTNVEKAIAALEERDLLHTEKMAKVPEEKLEMLIRPSGYFRQKAQRLKAISDHLVRNYHGELEKLFSLPRLRVRGELLKVSGLGKETADSILLYAGEKPVFVIDAYTRRICHRLGLTSLTRYDDLQRFFERNLPPDVKTYQEFHALLVALGKEHCRRVPRCAGCPVGRDCEAGLLSQV
ncbi:MAG: endonuclease III domain-containing protein [Actinomycetota bacterium]